MARKKQRLCKQIPANDVDVCYSFVLKIFPILATAIFLLAFINIWSSTTTGLSGNVVGIWLSLRKLGNPYRQSLVNQTASSAVDNVEAQVAATSPENKPDQILAVNAGKNETLDYRLPHIEDHLKTHHSWRSDPNRPSTCEGRGIYVYDLPSKFNTDLLSQCRDTLSWIPNFCNYFSNNAFGEPINTLGPRWYNTNQYSLEPIFHAHISNHRCRTHNPNEARLFYVPYYGGLDVLRWHVNNASNDVKDSLGLDLITWLQTHGNTSWYRNLGKDHVFVLGQLSWDFRRTGGSSWGTRFLELDEMQNPVKLLIERNPWHRNDVGIPYPTYFHPQTEDEVTQWQEKVVGTKRRSLVGFAGAPRPGAPESIRSVLIDQCNRFSNELCRFMDCSSGVCDDQPEMIIELFMESEFCLQPPGDSPTRKSVFDSLVSGCIPVVFDPMTVYNQYPWHFPEDGGRYSVFVDKLEVRNMRVDVVEKLMRIPVGERENMRRYIVYELLPGLVYGGLDSKFDDAFSISVNNLLERVGR